MKRTFFFFLCLFFLVSVYSQEKGISTPKVDKKCKELVNELNEYIKFRVQQTTNDNLSVEGYGRHIARQLIEKGYLKDFCLDDLLQTCLYNYACNLGSENYQVNEYLAGPTFLKRNKYRPIIDGDGQISPPQNDLFIIKCCHTKGMVNLGNGCELSCEQYMAFFHSTMSAIGNYLGINYTHWREGDVAYTSISKFY